MKCNHEEQVRIIDELEDPWTGEIESYYRWVTISTLEDVDLHRYKCTKCGEIGYYSGAAKEFYTKGVKSEGIKGLY